MNDANQRGCFPPNFNLNFSRFPCCGVFRWPLFLFFWFFFCCLAIRSITEWPTAWKQQSFLHVSVSVSVSVFLVSVAAAEKWKEGDRMQWNQRNDLCSRCHAGNVWLIRLLISVWLHSILFNQNPSAFLLLRRLRRRSCSRWCKMALIDW